MNYIDLLAEPRPIRGYWKGKRMQHPHIVKSKTGTIEKALVEKRKVIDLNKYFPKEVIPEVQSEIEGIWNCAWCSQGNLGVPVMLNGLQFCDSNCCELYKRNPSCNWVMKKYEHKF